MNFINYASLFVVLSISLNAYSQSDSKPETKSKLQICAEKKLKDFRVRNLVSISDEPIYIEKFKQVCAKEQLAASSEQQAQDAAARAEKEKDKKVVAAPTKPASSDTSSSTGGKAVFGPVAGPSSPSSSASGGSGGFVFGGCGGPAECEAAMAESRRVKYQWSSPGLQAYLGELWGNNFNYAHSLGGTYEQPESACNDKNQGELIAFDTGTELIPVACMNSHSTQEELKAMAAKIKSVKVDTLPVVVAVKKAKYEWKIITEAAKLEEGQMRFCTGPGSCSSGNVGKVYDEGNGCAVSKCIRIDGGPVKTAKKEEKKDEKKEEPVAAAQPTPKDEQRTPAQNQPQFYEGFNAERDGAAGP